MVKTRGLEAYSDCHHTDPEVARRIVRHFKPCEAVVLEPFAGNGAFVRALEEIAGPRSLSVHQCEVDAAPSIDFFRHWYVPVDWIVTNPPYSTLTRAMAHCFKYAERTVLLVPMSKVYSSAPRMELVRDLAGIEEQLVLGRGRDIGFDSGFPFAAMLFTRGYKGPTRTTWGG